jgi:NADPH:quinone reductase-like Zn-dependent oxidoreductase
LWGLLKPRYKILGADVSGVIESVGRNVTKYKPGDEVFGDLSVSGWGALAEYVCADERSLAVKPAGLNFSQAAAMPQAATLALQGLQDIGNMQSGQKVLINGAGGGVGTFAVQLAKISGTEITAVDKGGKLDMLRSLGAVHVIDYTKEDFTRMGMVYDLVLDVMLQQRISRIVKVLSPGGRYVIVGGEMNRIFQVLLWSRWISKTSGKKISILPHQANKDLSYLAMLADSGKLVPVIDRTYTLSEAAEAFAYFGEGNVKGKVVITVGN